MANGLTDMSMTSREFRNALGRYPTGIAVISTQATDGSLAGLTANSITPVSSDPVRLAWSLSVTSKTRPIFEQAEYFSVNILASDQVDIAKQFASSIPDRYINISHELAGAHRMPKIEGALAWYVCRLLESSIAGDHVMFIGEVIESEVSDGKPLLYFAGKFAQIH